MFSICKSWNLEAFFLLLKVIKIVSSVVVFIKAKEILNYRRFCARTKPSGTSLSRIIPRMYKAFLINMIA